MAEAQFHGGIGVPVLSPNSPRRLTRLYLHGPPFGENIYYADLNQLVEAWHRVRTDATGEAIIDQAKEKGLTEYQDLMRDSFREYYRVLKPSRWMTVVFHNSHNSVWNAIQEAMSSVGFVVADVRILDKQQSSYRQVTGLTAVKKDLVISAYRPSEQLEEKFRGSAGTEASAWEFVQAHLRQLPVFVLKGNRAETVAERQVHLLYDRMVAFHVQRGYAVPLSAAEFHAGLMQKFSVKDEMYFLPDQVNEYVRERMGVEVEQYQLFVSDEKSAIQWVRQQLRGKPTSYTDLQPLYMQEAGRVWEKHEQPLELRTILKQNFVEDTAGRWQVPDPKNEAHLEQLRHTALMGEFQQYLDSVPKKLKIVRTEALRAGFKDCWQRKDYKTIIQMAKRLSETVIQEDSALLMYYDNALLLSGE